MKRVDSDNKMSLSGSWSFRLDDHEIGKSEAWYQQVFEPDLCVTLPGTTTTNQIGESFDFDGSLNKNNVKQLRQLHRYIGIAWYQREVQLPKDWNNNQIILYLERVMFSSEVYLDGVLVGSNDSLSVAHEYNITNYVSPGKKHLLTVKIDNRDVNKIGTNPSAYTDETQTIWNGIIGKIQVIKRNRIDIQKIKVTPSGLKKEVVLKVTIDNKFSPEEKVTLIASIREKATTLTVGVHNEKLQLEGFGVSTHKYIVNLNSDMEVKLWSEFEPNLYEVEISINREKKEELSLEPTIETFGFRELKADGRQLKINERLLFLRGTLDCCVFPLTGYPPCDRKEWRRILTTVKAYGLNHVRYHSWCPPKACFQAADELGLYLQVEGPVWMDNWTNVMVGCEKEHYEYLPKEARRIIDAYGNHPSFCFFSNGNELNGDFTLLHDIIKSLKREDKRFLYTLTSNWDRKIDEMDDIFIAQCVDGVGIRGQYFLNDMVESTNLDYNQAVALREVPVISHEVGQYCIYPNMEELGKYTGVLSPVNFEAIYKDIEAKRMLPDAPKFMLGSGKLALQLYKEEIEAALRTASFGGIQLLDLHDFPGQSTATVGLLDAFWNSKGLVTPEEFRGFCSETVCLLRMDKRIYTNREAFFGQIQIANYGHEEIAQRICWRMTDQEEALLFEGDFKEIDFSLGLNDNIGEIKIEDLSVINRAKQVTIKVWIEGKETYNSWNIWIYPENEEEEVVEEAAEEAAKEATKEVTKEVAVVCIFAGIKMN